MQKVLAEMNIKLQHVLSDIDGASALVCCKARRWRKWLRPWKAMIAPSICLFYNRPIPNGSRPTALVRRI